MRSHFRYLVIFVGLTVASHAVDADEPSTVSPYSALHAKWKADKAAVTESIESKSEQKERLARLRADYTKQFVDLAQEHKTDEDTWTMCLIWCTVEGVPGDDFDDLVDLVGERAQTIENTIQLQLLFSELIPKESDRLNPVLKEIADSHKWKGVRGAAMYALAARSAIEAERSGSDEQAAAATELLERVIAEYPDVSTYRGENRDNAAALLSRLQGPAAPGKPAPELAGPGLKGERIELRARKGQVVVLAFSGHWCAPCRAMHPVQKELLAKYDPGELAIIEINSDQEQHLDRVAEKMRTDGLTWDVITDGSDGPLAKEWRISAHPTYFVVDQNQIIRRRATGHLGDRLSDWVADLIDRESSQ